jgi:opacity protein-like surface antigen
MKRFLAIGVSVACLAGQVLAADAFEAMQKKLGIPLSEGTVVDVSGRQPDMILIQDVHRHPEAQQHIRAMILRAMTRMGANEIFLEGAWTHGQNADYAFLGLEDPDAYRANVAAYEAVEKDRQQALQEIDTAQLFESALDAASPSWSQVKRLIQLRLKPAEYAQYIQHPFRPASDSALARTVEAAELFYEIANQRSDIFLAKAKEHHLSGPQVLVIGGFHTAGMAEKLRKEGISYVVLAPRVTQGGFEDLYSQGMHQTISALKLH